MSNATTAGRPLQQPRAITAASYVEAVHEFVRHPTGIGLTHEALSNFLRRTLPSNIRTRNAQGGPFLKLYAFNKENEVDLVTAHGLSATPPPPLVTRRQDKRRKTRWTLGKPQSFFDWTTFESHQIPTKAESPAQIILLSGYPNPEWLGVVGAKYKIDPELLARFLDFRATEKLTESFALPPLPASSWNILELPIVTIGRTSVLKDLMLTRDITAMRAEAKRLLHLHLNNLASQSHSSKLCSSVIRNITVFDQSHFAIEQRIWICLQPKQGINPWVLVIWTDSGDNGNETSLKAIWDVLPHEIQAQGPFLIPATRYRPNTGLYSHKYASFESPPVAPRLLRGFETGTLLHISFGRTLRSDLMSKDALYCLTEVMGLAASSENQFLNLIERKLVEYTNNEHDEDINMLPNLTYLRNVLYQQKYRILRVREWLKTHMNPQWPMTNDKNAVRSRDNVRQEYDHLIDRAHALVAQCQEAITVLMNTTAIQESRKGIEQSERTKKLAMLALIFAPLSFATSFFSMNVVELGDLRIWQWFVMATALLSAALLFYGAHLRLNWVAFSYNFGKTKTRF